MSLGKSWIDLYRSLRGRLCFEHAFRAGISVWQHLAVRQPRHAAEYAGLSRIACSNCPIAAAHSRVCVCARNGQMTALLFREHRPASQSSLDQHVNPTSVTRATRLGRNRGVLRPFGAGRRLARAPNPRMRQLDRAVSCLFSPWRPAGEPHGSRGSLSGWFIGTTA